MAENQSHKILSELAPRLDGQVHTSRLRRYLHATDGSIFFKQPAAVIYPMHEGDVQAAVRFAGRHHIGVHARGAGSGLCGSAIGGGLIIDFSKYMNKLLDLDLDQGRFACQPGYRLGELDEALKGTGWFFPPDPSSGEYATFGGMYATNASGAHSVKYGNVADYVLDAEVIWADGSLVRLSRIVELPLDRLPPRLRTLAGLFRDNAEKIDTAYPPIACNVAGYNLRALVRNGRLHMHRLLAGAEGTLGLVTRLWFRLAPKPAADSLVVAYFDDIISAARATQIAMKLKPSGIEVMDKSLLGIAKAQDSTFDSAIPHGIDNVLLMEWDGPSAEDCARATDEISFQLRQAGLTTEIHTAASEAQKQKFWAVRKAAVPILYKLKGRRKILALVEDAAVPVDQLVPYFRGIYDLFRRLQVDFVLYGHIAKGLMHTRPLLDLKDPRDVALLRPIADAVYDLVSSLGGTVSGEHGDGRLRSAYLKRAYPDLYGLFRQVKTLLDPDHLFNPEIKASDDPDQMSRHLRFGKAYQVRTVAHDALCWGRKEFFDEIERCHGCSKCTTITTATRMCPVYKFTRDERAAPKAKANVLRALISGAVPSKSLYEREFQQVMAQCVNCGSCYLECPSQVNIPKLAMEAKAQYVKRFGTRLGEGLTARIETVARLFHKAAPVLEPVLQYRPINRLGARLAGLAPQRELVRFARRSLYERLPRKLAGSGARVLYFAGCYAAYIRPELGEAAAAVLHRLGFQVHLPPQVCCGLPQLSKGLAAEAGRKADQNLHSWGRLLSHIDFIAVTCSSCGYALLQDWSYLLPAEQAKAVRAKTLHISDLINRHGGGLPPWKPLRLRAAYHQPCHLRLQDNSNSSLALMKAMPELAVADLKSHCCGMAGSWGMLAPHYSLSTAIAGPMIGLLDSSGADVGLTDCPTCQMQMEHLGRLPVFHPIELAAESLGVS